MDRASAVEYVFKLFGDEPFSIGVIKDPDMIGELADLLDIRSASENGRRTAIGRRFNKLRGVDFRTSSGTLVLDVCREADGSIPALYQIRRKKAAR